MPSRYSTRSSPPSWLAVCVALLLAGAAWGEDADWPAWRHDAQRSAATSHALPERLQLAWRVDLPAPKPAWYHEPRLQFDAAPQPVIKDGRLFVASSSNDAVYAFDAVSGKPLWRFHAEAPVRLAPLAWKDSLFFVCDDGWLYALDAKDGAPRWKFRAGPPERAVLGNGRLIDACPARGGPVLVDGTLYCAAGVWPFMGVFVHALDAETGKVLWTNDRTGEEYHTQPHLSSSYGGPSPQGYLAASGEALILPSGRARPAIFERATGALKPYASGFKGGSWSIACTPRCIVNGGWIYDLGSGALGYPLDPERPAWDQQVVAEGETLYSVIGTAVKFDLSRTPLPPDLDRAVWQRMHSPKLNAFYKQRNITGFEGRYRLAKEDLLEDFEAAQFATRKDRAPRPERLPESPDLEALWIKAGTRLYGHRGQTLMALDLPAGRASWQADIEGRVGAMAAASGMLFVCTKEGRLYAFGAQAGAPAEPAPRVEAPAPLATEILEQAQRLLDAARTTEGYALVLGLSDGKLLEALARRSNLRLIGVDRDAQRIDALRRRYDAAGLYGERLALRTGDPARFPFPPYLANLILSEDPMYLAELLHDRESQARLYGWLRPYGGRILAPCEGTLRQALLDRLLGARLEGAEAMLDAWGVCLVRAGGLPGAGVWTQQHGDAANTMSSRDELVQAPFGVLWYGGDADGDFFPDRHALRPRPQVLGGRLFVEHTERITALDVYTGRRLWQAELPGHAPQSSYGNRMVSTPECLYALGDGGCALLVPETGRPKAVFNLTGSPEWRQVAVSGEFLVACLDPLLGADAAAEQHRKLELVSYPEGSRSWPATSSRRLAVLDRHTGRLLWERPARLAYRHAALAAGKDRLFCVDYLPESIRKALGRSDNPAPRPALLALNLETGAVLWEQPLEIEGTWVGYDARSEALVVGQDALGIGFQPGKVSVRSAATGLEVWSRASREAHGYPISGTSLVCGNQGWDLETGKVAQLSIRREYSCTAILSSTHLLTYRSSCSGFLDLKNGSGTGNLGGMRAGCIGNLIAADGVLSAPRSAHGCDCNYSNQTSLALIHDPGADLWGWGAQPRNLRRTAVNLGAPGDRGDETGTFWLGFPLTARPYPRATVQAEGAIRWVRLHTSRVTDAERSWVCASAGIGLRSLTLPLEPEQRGTLTVRLHFAELEDALPGERVFDVRLQNRLVRPNLDVAKEAGGPRRGLALTFKSVESGEALQVNLDPVEDAKRPEPLLCGLELLVEPVDSGASPGREK
ncbi:MAG: PQQ-binding-like beta-propeller repeat protein [Planctomycetota bacterium]|nr:PQQ-binding-like beta-propeller repeat protein [Planctomycetota bacterium]